jgi:exonuclease SbcC
VLRAAEDGDRAVSELQELADRAADEAERAAAELAAIAERVGDRTAFTAFTELVARLEHEGAEAERRTTELQEAAAAVDQAASAVAGAERAGGAATTVAERAAKALARSSERVVSRDDSLHRARHAAAAGDLRRHLAEGSPCPVCDQIVATVPKAAAPAKVAAAETALATARSAEAEARAAWEAAQRDAATAAERAAQVVAARDQADATLATATAAARSAEAAVTATRSELVDRLGEGDPRALLQARQAELDDAERLAKELAATHARARDAVDAARREGADASKAVATLATRVAGTWGALQRPRDISADPAGVRLAFIELGEELLAQHHEAEADLLKAREQIGADVATVTAELDALGLPADADLARERSAVAAAVSAAEERLRALDDELAAGADLTARIVVATARRDLSRRLASDLQPSRFLAYLLAEERAALAELGSVHLEELTGGAYRFTDDDAFRIIDVNAGGAERPAESLSGGETFLASLALALALAEMVTRGGGRLDSFFLDEGFGSLDPEHLDRAMEGIGRLVAGDAHRLVVLVSHVELMRQLLEDLIVLDKDERTGDTRVVAGASLRD